MENTQKSILNPLVFVKDENDPAFRTHILRRLKEAEQPDNRLPIDLLKKRLARFSRTPADA